MKETRIILIIAASQLPALQAAPLVAGHYADEICQRDELHAEAPASKDVSALIREQNKPE